jgi:hypothetical protein
MRRSRSLAVCTALAASALAAALPVSAQASKAPSGGVKQAVFKATLSGSQVTTWEYHYKVDYGCGRDEDAFGDQQISFGDNATTFKITFNAPPKGQPDLFGTAGRPAVYVEPLKRRVKAKASRDADVKYGAIDSSQCPGDNGGGVPDSGKPEPDCGVRYGSFRPTLYFHDQGEDPDNLIVPIPTPHEKNHLSLDGWDYQWSRKGGGTEATELRNTYETCPFIFTPGTLDDLGQIYISDAKLSEKALFNRSRKKLVVSGHHIANRHDATSSGKTILAWNLRLTRVK